MAKYQVPEILIDQVQIFLRKEALHESFNPNDPSIPPPPTLEEAIAGIGSPDDQLLCEHCGGDLLRGSESIICVYCGRGQQQESPPHSIAFKSTLGFGWLLQSLHLDGSESVGPSTGGIQSNRELSSLKDGLSLSDFLNVDLKWPDESKRFGMMNESQLAGERYSTLVGVNLNELFPEVSSDNASVYGEEVVKSKKIEIRQSVAFPGQRNLNFFENTKPSESVLRSHEGENDESFSGWDAEFQSAVPDAGLEHMQSFENTEVPPADNTSLISVQGNVVEKSANMSSSHAHARSDLTDDVEFNFALPSQFKQSEGSILVDAGKVLKLIDASSRFTWPLDDQQKTAIADPSLVESRIGDLSFDRWSDFRVLTDVGKNHCEPSTATPSGTDNSVLDITDGWNDFTGLVSTVSNQPMASRGPDDDSLDVWNDFMVSSSVGETKFQTGGIDIYQLEKRHDVGNPVLGGNDFALLNEAQLGGQETHADASQNKTFSQDDSIGLWSTGISMAVLDDQLFGSGTKSPIVGTTNEADDLFNLWNDFKSSAAETQQVNISKGADNLFSAKDNRTSDVWDDFASPGARKNERKISREKEINSSFAPWNDNLFSEWNDLTDSSSAPVNKPNSNDTTLEEGNEFSKSAVTHTDQNHSGNKADETQTVIEDDDSFSSWSNLRSSQAQAENSFPSTIVTESSQGHMSAGKASEALKIIKVNSPFDAWGDFGDSVLMLEKLLQAGGEEISENKQTGGHNDFLSGCSESGKQSCNTPEVRLNSNGVMVHGGNSFSENDDLFDTWTGFTSSSNAPLNQSLSSSDSASVGDAAVEQDDIFDSWNVFTSSSNVQGSNNTMEPKENMPEISLFSNNSNSLGVESDSSYQQDVFLRVVSAQNGSSQDVSPPKVPDLVRTENGGRKADGYSEQINQSETTKGTSDLKPSDAETLISEMHDLSFMLQNSLSIPKSGE